MSQLLVDTHALLWWLIDDPHLSPLARRALADPANEPLVSAASVWEIAIKRSLGTLSAPDDLPERIVDEGFSWLAISPIHAWQVRDDASSGGDSRSRVTHAGWRATLNERIG